MLSAWRSTHNSTGLWRDSHPAREQVEQVHPRAFAGASLGPGHPYLTA